MRYVDSYVDLPLRRRARTVRASEWVGLRWWSTVSVDTDALPDGIRARNQLPRPAVVFPSSPAR